MYLCPTNETVLFARREKGRHPRDLLFFGVEGLLYETWEDDRGDPNSFIKKHLGRDKKVIIFIKTRGSLLLTHNVFSNPEGSICLE